MEKDGDTFLGWGRIELLERIDKYGSINAAARSMGMGYRHAWDLVDEMNRLSPKPLVAKALGGEGGGGSALTPEGKAAVKNFRRMVGEFSDWISRQEPRLWMPPKRSPRSKSSKSAKRGTR